MIKTYFNNIEDELSAMISAADKRAHVAVAWFTNERLFEELNKALQRKVEIKIIILDDILNRSEFGLDYGILTNKGAEVRYSRNKYGTMHNKFCIIDDKVITGSYNWTNHANVNDENIVVIDEPSTVNSYNDQFEKLFSTCDPINLPYEHIKWTDVKEGDFSELRRNIFREVIAQNDISRELKRVKLINLNQAYKSGNKEELLKASSLPTTGNYKTITDVLTSHKYDFIYSLWEKNVTGEPYDNVDGYIYFDKWFYVPYEIKEDKYHQNYVEGVIKTYSSLNYGLSKGLKLKVFDQDFIKVIKTFWGFKSYDDYKLIPSEVLLIEHAKLCYYKFPAPMFNKSQTQIRNGVKANATSAINIFGIAKEVDADNVVFYDGWDPQRRGEKIMKEFFVKAEEPDANILPTEQYVSTIKDILTASTKKYKGELFYLQDWDSDEQPSDERFSTIGKWIFIPEHFGEDNNHYKYVRGYLYFYNWYKKRDNLYTKIQIDIYDNHFISALSKFIKDNKDITNIPEDLICIDHAKLSIYKYPKEAKALNLPERKAIVVFSIVKETKGDNIVYYEGWDPKSRGKNIIEKFFLNN